MLVDLSYTHLVVYVFVGLFAIERVVQIFMVYCNVALIVLNYKYFPSWEAKMRSAGQYTVCVFEIKG